MNPCAGANVKCTGHGQRCMLKTGTSEGPNFGRHFYMCRVKQDRCSFFQEATNVSTLHCKNHGCMVELRMAQYSESHKQFRNYFRCKKAKEEKKAWCGYLVIGSGSESSSEDTSPVITTTTVKQPSGNTSFPNSSSSTSSSSSDDNIRTNYSNAKVLPRKANDSTSSLEDEVFRESNKNVTPKGTAKISSSHEEDTRQPPRPAVIGCQKGDSSSLESSDDSVKENVNRDAPVQKMASMTLQDRTNGSCSTQAKAELTKKAEVTASKEYVCHRSAVGNAKDNVVRIDDPVKESPFPQSRVQQLKNTGAPLNNSFEYRQRAADIDVSTDSSEDSDDDCQIVDTDPPSGPFPSATSSQPVAKLSTNQSVIKPTSLSKVTSLPAKKFTTAQSVVKPSSTCMLPSQPVVQPNAASGAVPKTQYSQGTAAAQSQQLGQKETRQLIEKNLEIAIKKKDELNRQLDSQMHIMNTVKLSSLPDGGAKIKTNIERLVGEITQQDKQLSQYKQALKAISNGGQNIKIVKVSPQDSQATGQTVGTNVFTVGQSQTGSGQQVLQSQVKTASGQVIQGASQTKITDHVTLPWHVMKQMYADNPQAMTLYGGRMTAARQQEVSTVTQEALEKLHKQLETCPGVEQEDEDPSGLTVHLMPHQRRALTWMRWREKQHPPGGILADDMGLGKTLTVISLIMKQKQLSSESEAITEEWFKKVGGGMRRSRSTLVICPASLVHQWEKEIQRRCDKGQLKVILYHGPNREGSISKMVDSDVVLTTYNIISREVGVPESMKKDKLAQEMPVNDQDAEDSSAATPLLMRIAWQRIVLDEAHNIKNHKSLTAMSTCRLKGGVRWALTGTPIQNDLLDVYSLLRFLRCSPFDEFKLWKRQVDNKSDKGKQRLNTLIKTLLLRRTKQETCKKGRPIVDLPRKKVVTYEIDLSPEEKAVYERIFAKSRSTMQEYIKRYEDKHGTQGSQSVSLNPWAKDDTPSKTVSQNPGFIKASQLTSAANQIKGIHSPKTNQITSGTAILLCLLRLRQCCGHLSLMKDAPDVETMEMEGIDLDLVDQMKGLGLEEEAQTTDPSKTTITSDTFSVDRPSTKVQYVLDKVIEIQKASAGSKPMKCVVVSQWTKMLDVIEFHLKSSKIECCSIRGDMPPKKRSEIVDVFNSDPKGPLVMLLSLRAGGVGLNLVGGNHLFMVDLHWNPALESQACDRIYRVGQERDVVIHRFVCKNTVEEKIQMLQHSKLKLAENILTGAGASANKLSLSDLKMLFDLDRPFPNQVGHIGAAEPMSQIRQVGQSGQYHPR